MEEKQSRILASDLGINISHLKKKQHETYQRKSQHVSVPTFFGSKKQPKFLAPFHVEYLPRKVVVVVELVLVVVVDEVI